MEFLTEYGLFLAKTITFVIAVGVVIALLVSASMRNHTQEKGHLEIVKINDKFDALAHAVKEAILPDDVLKSEDKEKKRQEKLDKKKLKAELKAKKADAKQSKSPVGEGDEAHASESSDSEPSPEQDTGAATLTSTKAATPASQNKKRIFVTDFDGDIKASATDELRQVISAILSIATENDEVVVRLESQGGMVHSYGLAASQLKRITNKNIPLTICVDKVAASGGYMMACVADKIVSAPFAVIGSIGVLAQLPNFHRLLKKHDVDFELFTAGEYKRTITMFGENTEKGRQKFTEELEDTHVLFKDFIKDNRPIVDVEKVATGEVWYGTRAIEQKLIDQIDTSDQYLFNAKDDAELYEVNYTQKKSLPEKLGISAEAALDRVVTRWLQRFNTKTHV
ncbi:putative protease SohB [Thalassocella blandensis]|nr:putative protease SohB [Thalassocella blandensis]